MKEDWPARVKRLEEEVAGLRRAMHTRGLIEQAKGMLAERLGCDPESAFRVLSTRSQETNTPLVRVAADLVAALPAELPSSAAEEPAAGHDQVHVGSQPTRSSRASSTASTKASLKDLPEDPPETTTKAPPKDPLADPSGASAAQASGTSPKGSRQAGPAPAAEHSIGLANSHQVAELRTITGLDRRTKAPALSMSANRALRLAIAAMDGAANVNELARAIATAGLKDQPDVAVALFAAEPDGALRLLAHHGWPARAASDWRRVPSSVNTVVAQAVRLGAPVVVDGMTKHEFVLIGPGEARVIYPLAIGDRVVGALAIAWPGARRIGEAMRLYLAHLATAAGRAVNGLWPAIVAGDEATAVNTDLDWVRAVLDGVHGNAYLLSPVREDDGSVADFRIVAVSGGVGEWVLGRRLLDVNPLLADNGVFSAYVGVLERGEAWQRPATSEETIINGRKRRIVVTRRASRVGGAVLGSWERLDEMISKEQHLARLEAFGGYGWAEWDLRTGEGRWSAGMYRLLGKDSHREPPPFESLPDLADPADRGRAERFVADLAAGRDGVVDIRVKGDPRDGDARWLRLFCEARPSDVPHNMIYLIAQDISDRYAREEHLRSLQSRAAAGRLRLASQQDLTARLVDLLYPKETVSLSVPGASVRGRHFLPDKELPLRADFCDAIALPGGAVLMLIGDMFGAGLTAAATAVRLVRPVLTLGLAGVPLSRVMEVLNSDLRRDDELSMASLMLVKFEPLSGELRYASAGHLPPILLKHDAKKPHLLSGNGGPALGLIEDAKFTEFSAHLVPGDAVVGFTDGVVDRRQTSPLASLATSFLKGYREGGPEALLSLPLPQVTDEACVGVLQVED